MISFDRERDGGELGFLAHEDDDDEAEEGKALKEGYFRFCVLPSSSTQLLSSLFLTCFEISIFLKLYSTVRFARRFDRTVCVIFRDPTI